MDEQSGDTGETIPTIVEFANCVEFVSKSAEPLSPVSQAHHLRPSIEIGHPVNESILFFHMYLLVVKCV